MFLKIDARKECDLSGCTKQAKNAPYMLNLNMILEFNVENERISLWTGERFIVLVFDSVDEAKSVFNSLTDAMLDKKTVYEMVCDEIWL